LAGCFQFLQAGTLRGKKEEGEIKGVRPLAESLLVETLAKELWGVNNREQS